MKKILLSTLLVSSLTSSLFASSNCFNDTVKNKVFYQDNDKNDPDHTTKLELSNCKIDSFNLLSYEYSNESPQTLIITYKFKGDKKYMGFDEMIYDFTSSVNFKEAIKNIETYKKIIIEFQYTNINYIKRFDVFMGDIMLSEVKN